MKEAKAATVEVCFVLDTTGSMKNLIAGAKRKIGSIANQIVMVKPTPTLRVGLIGSRDRGDVYVTKQTDLNGEGIASALHPRAARGATPPNPPSPCPRHPIAPRTPRGAFGSCPPPSPTCRRIESTTTVSVITDTVFISTRHAPARRNRLERAF
ncbi:MAG: hypothetical protein ACYS0E_01675 [Planctomycetota bacterium]